MTFLNLPGYCGVYRGALDKVRTIMRLRLWLFDSPRGLTFRVNALEELDAIHHVR
jgi:hypothetical protein